MFKLRTYWNCKVLLLVSVLAFAVVAKAQETGSIIGVVEDPSGAVIPNARVTVSNQSTNVSVVKPTNSTGLYRVDDLIPGMYSVKVGAEGFKTVVHRQIQVTVGSTTRADVAMELGQAIQTVTVEASAPLVNTEEGRLSNLVGAEQVGNLPLNGRNVFDLIKMAPGAVDTRGVTFENSNQVGSQTVVNGVRQNFNGFVLDGVANKDLSGGFVNQPNQDTVQEFQVNTLNISAQYGNSAGSITNLVTKSGGNSFHGSLYEYVRNDSLDATDFFTNLSGGKKNPLHFNQFGGTLGGPIRKDKTFFFASYQGDRTVTSAAPQPVVIESAQWRNAVVNALPNSVAALLYKNFPGPGGPTISTVSSFVNGNYAGFDDLVCPDNTAGTARIASSFQKLFGVTAAEQAACPTAITAGQTATQAANRLLPFEVSGVAQFGSQSIGNLFNGTEWSGRIDHNIGDKERIFGRYNYEHQSDKFGPSNVSNLRGFRNPSTSDFPNFALSWTHIFGPRLINEAKVGYTRNSTNIDVPLATAGVPSIGLDSGDIGFGSYNGYPQFFHDNIYTYADMVSISKGKHAIKIGGDLRRNIENSEFNVARPSYYFFDPLFFAADAPYQENAGVDPGILTKQPARLYTNNRAWRNWEFGGYIQDDWKVKSNLTLNLGLRYDLYQRHQEKYGRMTQFILGPGNNITERMRSANAPAGGPGCNTATQIAQAPMAGICGAGGYAVSSNGLGGSNQGDHNNFGPRFGFAWDPFKKGKTAIRGGFGVSYEGTLYNPLSNSRWNLPYYSFNQAINFLAGVDNNVVYGPSKFAANGSVVFDPTQTPSYTGTGTNPGQGTGVQANGNLVGWDPTNPNLGFRTGIVDPGGLRDPYVYSWFQGVQHQFTNTIGIEINYVGTAGHKLFRAQDTNRNAGGKLPAGTCSTAYKNGAGDSTVCSNLGPFNTSGRTNPNYGQMRFWENAVNSIYNSLQFSATKKMSKGLAFNFNYTWGHAIDGGSGWHNSATGANGSGAGDGYNLDVAKPNLDRGNSIFDIRHRIVANYVWELPWMKAQQGFVGHVLGGWQLNGLWSYQSGAHWEAYRSSASRLVCSAGGSASTCLARGGTVNNTGGDYNLDGVNNDRPNVAGPNHINETKDQWANGAFFGTSGVASGFFTTPCLACNGSLGRNTFVGPNQFTADLSLFKKIKVTEKVSFQFRAEFFNALNRTNFKMPSSSTGANYANRIQSANFGSAASTFDPRQIQLALKLLF